MTDLKHLTTVHLQLRTLSPVFIGTGKVAGKKECIFDMKQKRIHFPDMHKLYSLLGHLKKLEQFEQFMLNETERNLFKFLQRNGIGYDQYPNFVRYSIDAGEAAQQERFHEVSPFIKDAYGFAYIPGSSLKGVFRTALAAQRLKGTDHQIKDRVRNDMAEPLESRAFCVLKHNHPEKPDRIKWDNKVNDFMRGIQISDSSPIPLDRLTLCQKIDKRKDGSLNPINAYRECLMPDTTVRFALTLENSILNKAGLTLDGIMMALESFSRCQQEQFIAHFPTDHTDAQECATTGVELFLGGGAGFASKTLLYPLLKRDHAVRVIANMLAPRFKTHRHNQDIALGVSPHMVKMTRYQGLLYHMGRCELTIQS